VAVGLIHCLDKNYDEITKRALWWHCERPKVLVRDCSARAIIRRDSQRGKEFVGASMGNLVHGRSMLAVLAPECHAVHPGPFAGPGRIPCGMPVGSNGAQIIRSDAGQNA
jgi:hypothetical protein